MVTYNATTDNQYMNTDNNVWAKLYEAIERANSAITGMDEYSDMSNANMRQFYGELLTLRAFIYFDLIKAFGVANCSISRSSGAALYPIMRFSLLLRSSRYRPSPGIFSPPVSAPISFSDASSTTRTASFTAAAISEVMICIERTKI